MCCVSGEPANLKNSDCTTTNAMYSDNIAGANFDSFFMNYSLFELEQKASAPWPA